MAPRWRDRLGHMATLCGVCKDPRRLHIEVALRGSQPRHDIAKEFGIPKTIVDRHARNHMAVVKNDANAEPIEQLKIATQRIIDRTKDDKVRLGALQRMQGLLEHELRTRHEAASESSAESFASHPAVVAIVDAVCRAVADCPVCTDRLVESLVEVKLLPERPPVPVEGGVPAE